VKEKKSLKGFKSYLKEQFSTVLREGLEGLDNESLLYILNEAESMLFNRLWGSNAATDTEKTKARVFKEDGRSLLTVKNELTRGQYAITVCLPEQDTMKLDLQKVAPDPSSKVKQIRILFTRKDWRRINGF
jgi:hypothetical protein